MVVQDMWKVRTHRVHRAVHQLKRPEMEGMNISLMQQDLLFKSRKLLPRADENSKDEDEEEDDYGFSPVAPATTSVAAPAPTGFSGQILNMGASNKQEVVLFRPGSFNDTSKAADDLRNRKAVIVNMENVDKAMARRVVDFLSGCVYALDGDVKKIAQSAYLFCPHNMDIVGDLESLQAEVESYI